MDLKKGQELLDNYTKAQEDLQKQLHKVMREIDLTYYVPKTKQRSAIRNVLDMTEEALSKKRA